MKQLIALTLIIVLYTYNNKLESCSKKAPSEVKIEIVLYDLICLKEASDLKSKIKHTSRKIFKDFNLIDSEIYTIHVWQDYDKFLIAQEKNIGIQYPGSSGYIFSNKDIALHYNDDIVEIAEHEFVHVASLHLNSNFGNNPRWLWESVAIYESGEFVHPREIEYLLEGNFPTLKELNGLSNLEDDYKVYDVGYLLSEFIIENWSRQKYLDLIIESGDIDKVLKISELEFEKQWEQFVTERYID